MIELDGESFGLQLPVGEIAAVRGSGEPYAGWWSDTYGRAEPASVIQTRCDATRPTRWVVRLLGDPGSGLGSEEVSTFASSVVFDETRVQLRIEADGRTSVRNI
jgi:hypothetical protein